MFHHRFTGLPDIEIGVQRARHTFGDHHGFLQQQQLWLSLHVELLGHLKQLREQARHGNFASWQAHDRLTNSAQRLGKSFYIFGFRNITSIKMHLRNAAIIAGDEAIENLSKEQAVTL